MRSFLMVLLAFGSVGAQAQDGREPIIDMHLHIRSAAYAGENPPPMCAPFAVMPRSDNRDSIYQGISTSSLVTTRSLRPPAMSR